MLKIINWLIPPRCLQCGDIILEAHQLCSSCWKDTDFINKPFCEICGHPLVVGTLENECISCLRERPVYDKARSILVYKSTAKDLILRFKHADSLELAPLFAHWIYNYQKDFLMDADYLIPVPLHWTRLLYRRYNQAAILCLSLRKLFPAIPAYAPNFLRRVKRTESQGHKKKNERQKNIENAFLVSKSHYKKLQEKSVLLIDDVMTSASTVEECSRILYAAGCSKVKVLTVARVLKDEGFA